MSGSLYARSADNTETPFADFVARPARRRGQVRCLIAGAGRAGRAIARDLLRISDFGLQPIGFVDEYASISHIGRLPVLGRMADLPRLASQKRVEVLVVAMPSLPPSGLRKITQLAAGAGLSVRYLPSLVAALERDTRVRAMRRLRLDQLLGRQEVKVQSLASRECIEGKRVLVTGAGGSIGSELCRQISALRPSALYLLDHDESNLHRLQLETTGQALLQGDDLIIADIRDADRMCQIFKETRPDIVFHAAAHKHLPLLELHPCEAVKSNVLGTWNLVKVASEMEVERFTYISTDKAADPVSVLGATKRVGEMLVQAHSGNGTKFASVRFGNVLGSRGSFLSVLAEQFERSLEITVTHPDAMRFFMTVDEAAGLVLEAAAMAHEGEVFALDMGEQVRIVDLVRNYAVQCHIPADALSIRFTGLRPGEKLSETLFGDGERRTPTRHPRIWAAQARPPTSDFVDKVERLVRAAAHNQAAEVRCHLAEVIPEYRSVTNHPEFVSLSPYPDDF